MRHGATVAFTSLSRRLPRQFDLKGCFLSGLAFHRNAAVMRLNDPLGDIKTEAIAFLRGGFGLPSSFKQQRELIGGNAWTGVFHHKNDIAVASGRFKIDGAVGGREFDRVADQIRKHLHQTAPIALNFPEVGRKMADKLNLFFFGQRLEGIDDVGQQLPEIFFVEVEREVSRLDFVGDQQILDQPLHLMGHPVDAIHDGYQASIVGLKTEASLDQADAHADGGDGIFQIMGHDAQYFFAKAGGAQSALIQAVERAPEDERQNAGQPEGDDADERDEDETSL